MPKRGLKRLLVAVATSGALIAIFQNCSQPTLPATKGSNAASSVSSPLTVQPAAVTLAPGGVQSFRVAGGSGNYTVVPQDGCGTVTGTYSYTAPAYNISCTLIVNDVAGAVAYATITVTGGTTSLAATYMSAVSGGSDIVTITPSGGTGSYTYTKLSGAGTLAGNVYTTSASGETAQIQVSDGHSMISLMIVVPTLTSPTQTVYRLYSMYAGDYMESLFNTEGNNLGYAADGSTITTFTTTSASRVQLIRCKASSFYFNGIAFVQNVTHSASTSADCEGKTPEGGLGYLEMSATSQAPNALYRCASGMITKVQSDCTNGGYLVDRTLGYVP